MRKYSGLSFILILGLLLASCQHSLDSSDSKTDEPSSKKEYGSLTVSTASAARALDVSSIVKADVTLDAYGESQITKKDVDVSGGKGSVTIENIPVGTNYVVSVQAKENIENVLQNIAGVKMSAVTDINAGANSVTVNWNTTAVGNVFRSLIEKKYDVTKLSVSTVEALIPSGVHASLVDTDQIATDIKAKSTKSADSYALAPGSVIFTADAASSAVKIQVTDPVSKALSSCVQGTNTIEDVAPGTWKVSAVLNETVLYKGSVTITTGSQSDLGVIYLRTPKPRLEDESGNEVGAFVKESGATVYLASRSYDGEAELSGVKIYYTTDGSTPTANSTLYTGSGISVTVGSKLNAIAVYDGLLDSEVSYFEFKEQKLGQTHPDSGDYSPVDETSWASASYALGAHVASGATTFALYSANATKVLLEIYSSAYGTDAQYDYWLTKGSDNVWRAKLSGDLSGKIYAFRVWGPNWKYSESWTRGNSSAGYVSDCDSSGNRFNPNKVVFDPYAREMTHDPSNAAALACSPTANTSAYGALSTGATYRNYDSGKIAPKGYIITDNTDFGTKPQIAQKDAIIYEAHVRGITKHSSTAQLSSLLSGYDGFGDVVDIPSEYRGTYKGAALLVPYLKALGVNTIELLPVHETDNDANPDDGPGGNFWGYMTFDYFAPDRRYSSDKTAGGPTREFKEMVKTFHDAGMEVYLDVVYNHSGEGGPWNGSTDSNAQCTVVSMRGIDNATYYSLVASNKSAYWETSGCGNNLQCDNKYVRQFILDSLTYWIDEMGVDGFRFDLATVLGRQYNSSSGNWEYSNSAATTKAIAALGTSKNVEMVAESWDCGGDGYAVGNFPDGWAGWNGYYRDTARAYIGNAATSANISYTDAMWGDSAHFSVNDPSVNFIVAHDGFTLADLCSYDGDGNYYNSKLSWPFGPSDGGNGDNNAISTGSDAASRRQRARNYMAFQMFSAGIPMIVYGDELGRTQNGNNNPYNIDSVATWNNYLMAATSAPQAAKTYTTSGAVAQETGTYSNMFGTYANTENKNGQLVFSSFVLNERLNNSALRQITGDKFTWYSTSGTSGWADEGVAKAIMITGDQKYYVMMNMNGYQTSFTVPASSSGKNWVRIIDTGSWAEKDFNCWSETDSSAYSFSAKTDYGVGAYTIVVFKEVAQKAACATPSISGETPFETSSAVSITCDTTGAAIYYTTDGTTPSTSSTKYTGSFSITQKTTVKAIAVLSGYNNSSVASKTFYVKGTISESDKSGVMLQGFNWDSAPRGSGYSQTNRSPYWDRWYKVVSNNADSISSTFEYLWCPPPSMTDTASSEGYGPTQLNNLNNCYGTEDELKSMITAISPTKAIADIVINHRAGTTSWGDFTNPSWCEDYYAICSDDEGFSDSSSPMYNSSKHGAKDTGATYGAYRDLDHTNTDVQNGIITWMNDVLKPAGFVGWRYDYVKGYGGQYVGQYDAATSAVFSVGEYWPTDGYSSSNPSGWGNEIKNWITATENGGYRSRAFDFALKGAMNAVFNDGAGYSLLADSSNLYISQPSDAVTFVDNHDTGSTQGHWPVSSSKVPVAYALILTHPGVPCVAWQHYFTYSESGSTGTDGGSQYLAGNTVSGTSNTLRAHIDKLIEIRKENGIEYDSTRTTLSATSSVYAAKVEGTNGTLVVVIGGSYTPTGDYGRIYKGTNFTIWKEGAEDVYSGGSENVTLTVEVESWVWNDSCTIFAWVWGDSSTGEWITVSGSGTSVQIEVPADTTGFNMARCPSGTTEPNWKATGNSSGRIYNKTNDVAVTSGTTSYSTTWVEYNP